jgi:hypothetical protein
VKNRFQNLPFKRNLQRYTTDVNRVLIRGRTQRTATVDEVIAMRNGGGCTR